MYVSDAGGFNIKVYKAIDEVMENSKDLVKIEHELRSVLNVKGD